MSPKAETPARETAVVRAVPARLWRDVRIPGGPSPILRPQELVPAQAQSAAGLRLGLMALIVLPLGRYSKDAYGKAFFGYPTFWIVDG